MYNNLCICVINNARNHNEHHVLYLTINVQFTYINSHWIFLLLHYILLQPS